MNRIRNYLTKFYQPLCIKIFALQASHVPTQNAEKLPENTKILIQEQKPPSQESSKLPEHSTTPTKSSPSLNTETDPFSSEDQKETDNTVPIQEIKQIEKDEELSTLPVETDPLSTEKEESSTHNSTEQPANSVENEEPLPQSASIKNQEETSENSTEYKNTNENDQEIKTTSQLTSKTVDAVSIKNSYCGNDCSSFYTIIF